MAQYNCMLCWWLPPSALVQQFSTKIKFCWVIFKLHACSISSKLQDDSSQGWPIEILKSCPKLKEQIGVFSQIWQRHLSTSILVLVKFRKYSASVMTTQCEGQLQSCSSPQWEQTNQAGQKIWAKEQIKLKLTICAMTSCSTPEHPSRPFLDQTLCEHSGGLVGRAAK